MYNSTVAPSVGENQTTYNEACGTLQQLNRVELQKLMDDNDALNQLIGDMAMVKKLEKDKEGLLVTNASLAEYNLSREPQLISARQQLADTYEKAVVLQKQHERNLLRLDNLAVNTSPEATHAVLQTELAKVEEESEALADRFSSGSNGMAAADIETFINQYIRLRTLAHMRRTKVDKLAEMLRETHQQHPAAPQQQYRSYGSESINSASSAVPPIPARTVPIRGTTPYPPAPPVASLGWAAAEPQYPQIGNTASAAWSAFGATAGYPPAQMAYTQR